MSARSLAKRLKKVEQRRGVKLNKPNAVMVLNPIQPVDVWEHFAVMGQEVLKKRARYEGPEPDEVAHPYPQEYIDYGNSLEVIHHA